MQASAETAPDRGPALAFAVVDDQMVRLSRGVQLILDLGLLERPRGDPSSQRPGSSVERGVSPTWWRFLEVGDHAIQVGLAAAPIRVSCEAQVLCRRRRS